MEFAQLALAGLAWFLLHAAVAGSRLRVWLVTRVGEKRYRGGFSVASLASLWWLIHEFGQAPFRPFAAAPSWVGYVPLVVVPLACVLLMGAFTAPNPTAVGGEKWLDTAWGARGVQRVTRHPFLWSAVLWALSHLAVNLDVGSWLFFGSLGLTALRGSFDIDRKRQRTNPEGFERLAAVTSNVPFQAMLQGRTRFVLGESWLALLLGLGLGVLATVLHPYLFGVSAVAVLGK